MSPPAPKIFGKCINTFRKNIAGADAAIINPCNNDIMASIVAAEAMPGRDEFCMGYIAAHREGKLAGKGRRHSGPDSPGDATATLGFPTTTL
jgi:hypothetical protein